MPVVSTEGMEGLKPATSKALASWPFHPLISAFFFIGNAGESDTCQTKKL